ncbi:MAG: LamG-like jellyroll fold domain-containing protein [Luteolibacter sp.]|uniref:LamG-like jellyroll fold domain-containing protein n=1 Tax=Luteolibacter sp. TaxID=1962973 RepID=UPI0032660030
MAIITSQLTVSAQEPPATFTRAITTGTQSVSVDFAYHPIRSSNFGVLVQQADGSYTTYTAGVARTYLGTVTGYPGAIAMGLLRANGTLLAKVAFEDGKTWYTTGGNATAGGSSFTPVWPTSVVGNGGAGSTVFAAEVGIDLTNDYYVNCGGTVDAMVEKCEFSVMSADMVYLRDAAILHRIGKIIVRADAAQDPYATDGADTNLLLPRVRTVWNTGTPMGSTHDLGLVVHSGANGGLAYVGTVGTSSKYSANDSDLDGDFSVVWRHEAGHNWSSNHYEGGGNPEGSTIMSNNSLSRFSSSELLKIITHRATRTVLDNLGSYSFPLPPRANQDTGSFLRNSSTTLDVLANDSDSNGQALALQSFDSTASLGGSLTRSVGTGPGGRDQITYTPPPTLASGTDWFKYRVQDSAGMQAVGYAMLRPRSEVLLPTDRWTLDDASGTTALNSIRTTQNGVHQNGTLVNEAGANSVTAKGAYYDGTNDQTSITAPGYATNTLTFTVWLKRNGNQIAYAPLVFSRAGSTIAGLHFGTSNELRYTWDDGGYTWNSGLVPPDNTWCLAAMAVSPTGTTLLLRTPSGLQSATNSATLAAEAFNGVMYLGYDSSTSTRHYKGWMDDVRVYNATLTAAEIESLYQQAANPPSVSLTSPLQGATISPLAVPLAASVTTFAGLVDQIEFVENSTVLATDEDRPYQVTLFSISSGGHTLAARASFGDWGYQVSSPPVTFTAAPPPLPTVTVTASLPASKRGPVPGSFTISRSHPIGSITVPFSIGGTGVAGTDYQALSTTSVTFPDGSLSQTVTVSPIAAAPDGLAETVILGVSSGSGFTTGSPGSATLTINDHITSIADGEWDVAATWNSAAAAPVSGTQNTGETYAVAHIVTSNNTDSNSQALVAGGIRIKSGGILDLARLHAATTQNVSYNLPATVVEDGGTIRFRASVGTSAHTAAAALNFSGNTTLLINGGSYGNSATLSGAISGSGNINVFSDTNAGSGLNFHQISITSGNNPFSGNWTIKHTNGGDEIAALRAAATKALGTGTVTVQDAASLINDHATGLNSLSGVVLDGTDATLTLNQPWTNSAATLSLSGISPLVQLGNATTQIGSLSGSSGVIQGTGSSSILRVNQTTEGFYSGRLGTNLTFAKAGSAPLTLAGNLDPSLALRLEAGSLISGLYSSSITSLVQTGGNLVLPLYSQAVKPLTLAGAYQYSGGTITLDLSSGSPVIGSPYTLLEYGSLSGAPQIVVPAGLNAVIDYGTGSNSRITVTLQNTVQLVVTASPVNGGTVTGGGMIPVGSLASITATPADGWRFLNWTGTGITATAQANTTVLADTAKTVVAVFEEIDLYQEWIDLTDLTGNDALPGSDPDGDGFTNYIEYLFDFQPDDANSGLRMSISVNTAGTPSLLINKVIPEGSFHLEWSTDLQSPWPNSMPIPVSATATNFPVTPPVQAGKCFYRLRYVAPAP